MANHLPQVGEGRNAANPAAMVSMSKAKVLKLKKSSICESGNNNGFSMIIIKASANRAAETLARAWNSEAAFGFAGGAKPACWG